MIISFSFSCFGQYTIDSSFNINGTNEFTQFAGNVVNGQKIAYNSDNSIIVAGRWNDQLTVWKYLQSGQLDSNFGLNGMSSIPMPSGIWTLVKDLEILDDGRIMVLADAFLFYPSNLDYSQSSIVLARFLPNGTPDSSFNGTGILITRPQIGFEYITRTLEKSASGAIYVGGYVTAYGHYSCASAQSNIYAWFIAKFLENGAYDLTFNTTGYLQQSSAEIAQSVFQPISSNASILDIKELSDNKILLAGAFNGQDHGYFSIKLLPDGTYDNSYALNGRNPIHDSSIYFPSTDGSYAYIQDNSSILFSSQYCVYGVGSNVDSSYVYLYKLTDQGDIDMAFGINGELQLNIIGNQVRTVFDNQNRLVFSWYSKGSTGMQDIGFKRFMPDGSTDLSFGVNGTYIHEPIPSDSYMNVSVVNDLAFSNDYADLSIVTFRSASYVPATFRVLNYWVDTTFSSLEIDAKNNSELIIYPNPFHSSFTISSTNEQWQGAIIKLIDSFGREILSSVISEANQIILTTDLQSGTYFVSIQSDSCLVLKKLFKF